MKLKLFLFILLFSGGLAGLHAQDSLLAKKDTVLKKDSTPTVRKDTLTIKDAKEIIYQAKAAVQGFQSLLNYVSFAQNIASELQEVIANSYKKGDRNQVFFDKDIVIEDDLDPVSGFGKTKDITAERYLNSMDILYEKSNDATIEFSNIVMSSVKKKDYIYIKVKFDSKFIGKNKSKNAGYDLKVRQALVRMVNEGKNTWKALIVGISFYDPLNPIESADNNMEITTGEDLNATVISEEEQRKQAEAYIKEKEELERKNNEAFSEYVTLANSLIPKKQYKEALELFLKAKDIKPMVPSLDKQIIETRKAVAEYTFENFKNKADQAKKERRFNDAILFYTEAIALDPSKSAINETEIKPLTVLLGELTLPKNRLEASDFDGAIATCEELLKDKKRVKSDYPELYYIQGLAYHAKAARKPDDNKLMEKALENFNLAITYFPGYLDARLARANYYAMKNDFVSAITDYDIVTTSLKDDSPLKPGYIAARAKLRDRSQNFSGAFDDYKKAIALNPKDATLFYDQGELQFRIKKYQDALVSFNEAIKLNPKYNSAFYMRGLNYIELKNTPLAGSDFRDSEKFGLDSSLITVMHQKSDEFFTRGQEQQIKEDYKAADSLFNNALDIWNCNSPAWFNKGEIRTKVAELAQEKSKKTDVQNYRKAIDYYQKAIACRPLFSDAHSRLGNAYSTIREDSLAVQSYAEAIKSNSQNTSAYLGRGKTYMVIQNYNSATEDYQNAIFLLLASYEKSKKNDPVIKNSLSVAYKQLGEAFFRIRRYEDAMLNLDKAVSYTASNTEALYYRGQVWEAQSNIKNAIKNYEDALLINPYSKYYFSNGKAYHKLANYKSAIQNYESAIAQDSLNDVKNKHYLRGLSLYKSANYEGAMADFISYAKTKESKMDTSFYADYGFVNLYLNKNEDAIANFDKALILKGDQPNALFGLGCAYAKAGEFEKALSYMEKAFKTGALYKDEIKLPENDFLDAMLKVKEHKNSYNQFKKTYPPLNN